MNDSKNNFNFSNDISFEEFKMKFIKQLYQKKSYPNIN